MRCPACQALNPASAEWCTQCYAALREPEPAPLPVSPASPAPAPDVATPADAPLQVGDGADERTSASEDAEVGYVSGDGRFRRTDEGLDWACSVCDGWNPIEVTLCTTCRTPFVGETETGPAPSELTSESTAVLASGLLPGLGHILMGRVGAGAARAFLYVTWLAGGLLLLRSAVRAGQASLPAMPLLLGALVIWGTSIADAITLHRGRGEEFLKPRVLLWLTVAVIGATMLSFAGAALSVTSSA